MTYNFENLGDEDFQRLASALALADYPKAQMLPTGQPDGGRDAFTWLRSPDGPAPEIVFQVKFAKNPAAKEDRQAIEELIALEAKKIERLIQAGMTSYVLITNVKGTAHRDVGSIDRVNTELTARFGIDCSCWWRDDLEARLALNPQLAWAFPAILKGTDVLGMLLASDTEDEKRRLRAVKAMVANQHDADREVKFREIDLKYPIASIYVDTQFTRKDAGESDGQLLGAQLTPHSAILSTYGYASQSTNHCRILLEGAPGQGKSTVTQFISQVNRLHFLNRQSDLDSLPEDWRPVVLRVPLRADLRDYATWRTGSSPFASSRGQPHNLDISLDVFLAALIANAAGGVPFDVNDLHAVFQGTRLLLVLDGFDEVPDPQVRVDMATAIDDCALRLEQTCFSVHIFVTSRPSALLTTPCFTGTAWVPLVLSDLTPELAVEYTTKWARLKRLDSRDAAEVVAVLEAQMREEHIRELSRNPMQLSILATLILSQGDTLPNKRTSLYADYIKLFFDRESQKSATVKQHRTLLIMLHEFIAYTMHCDAEYANQSKDRRAGSLTLIEIKGHITDFLTRLGEEDMRILDGLFTAMKERVVALVQNVQGTYEFQVQPLREYFAAKYLYNSASIKPGATQGTRPQIYRAIITNPYWNNVTRFYAGSYSAGEVASLVDDMIDVGTTPPCDRTAFLSYTGKSYLQDYVLENQTRLAKRLIDAITRDDLIDFALCEAVPGMHEARLRLPERCGARSFGEAIIANAKGAGGDRVAAMCRIAASNLGLQQRLAFFDALASNDATLDREILLWDLSVIDAAPIEVIDAFFKDGIDCSWLLLSANRNDYYDARPDRITDALDYVLSFSGGVHLLRRSSILAALAPVIIALDPNLIEAAASSERSRSAYSQAMAYYGRLEVEVEHPVWAEAYAPLIEHARSFIQTQFANPAEANDAWGSVLADAIATFGVRSSIFIAASSWAQRQTSESLTIPALQEWQDARDHRADAAFWAEKAALPPGERSSWALHYVAQAAPLRSSRAESALLEAFETLPEEMQNSAWMFSRRKGETSTSDEDQSTLLATLDVSPSAFSSMFRAIDSSAQISLCLNHPKVVSRMPRASLEIAYRALLEHATANPEYWPTLLEVARAVRLANQTYSAGMVGHMPLGMPLEIAEQVCCDTRSYPLSLVSFAEQRKRGALSQSARKIREIAEEERWFSES